ncbi:MAG: TetR/AcrR family transcriptional regulator [Mycobacterium sp.]
MRSNSNATSVDIGDRILESAAECVRVFGVERVTLAEIARRAGVSRPTVYRRWSDTQSVLAALLTARVTAVLEQVPPRATGRRHLVERIVAFADHIRHDDVVMAILSSGRELAMVYIVERLGTSQQVLIDAVAAEIREGQHEGSIRHGDPRQLAAMMLLITQSAIQSARIVSSILPADALATELTHSLDGYLR